MDIQTSVTAGVDNRDQQVDASHRVDDNIKFDRNLPENTPVASKVVHTEGSIEISPDDVQSKALHLKWPLEKKLTALEKGSITRGKQAQDPENLPSQPRKLFCPPSKYLCYDTDDIDDSSSYCPNRIQKSPGFDESDEDLFSGYQSESCFDEIEVQATQEGTEVSLSASIRHLRMVDSLPPDNTITFEDASPCFVSAIGSTPIRNSEHSSDIVPTKKNGSNVNDAPRKAKTSIKDFTKRAMCNAHFFDDHSTDSLIYASPKKNDYESLISSERIPPSPGPIPICGSRHILTPERHGNKYVLNSCCGADGVFNTSLVLDDSWVQKSIEDMLSDDKNWCSGWHTWSVNMNREEQMEGSMNKTYEANRVLRNRACSLHATSRRMNILKKNMDPFSSLLDDCQDEASIRRALSYDIPGTTNVMEKHSKQIMNSIKERSEVLPGFRNPPQLNRLGLAFNPHTDEDSLCYDSDPGVISQKKRGMRSSPKAPRNKKDEQLRPSTNRKKTLADVQNYDQSAISDMVQAFLNRSMTLIWHQTDADAKPHHPVSVTCWMERGYHINIDIIQPKFVWRRNHSAKSQEKILFGHERKDCHGTDLIDISHILVPENIDRRIYPFARSECSFKIKYYGEESLFEASSTEERDEIVHSLKMTVARLGTQIILNDPTYFIDFFHPNEFKVPGEAPEW